VFAALTIFTQWIPAFAGMTGFVTALSLCYKTKSLRDFFIKKHLGVFL